MTILSWNINRKRTNLIYSVLPDIIEENSLDIIVLQECFGTSINTLLSASFDEIPYPSIGVGSGVRVFLKKNEFKYFSIERTDNKKLVFVHLKRLTTQSEFNIAAVHFHSKVGNTERQQMWKNLPIIRKIVEYEKTITNNNKTILIGDFNHNPYESNLTDPSMINAVGNKNLVRILTSNPVTKKDFNFWYNPMWNLLGDYDFHNKVEKVTGSYFRYTEDETPIWNLLDGMIVRPSLMDKIDFTKSEIITKTKKLNFLKPFITRKDETLIKDDLSDHLPIKFTLLI